MRRLLVAGNWKMHGDMTMTAELIEGVGAKIANSVSNGHLPYDVLVCPAAPFLGKAISVAGRQSVSISVGAQNVSPHVGGAYTGEVSLSMLKNLGCDYVLLGHSERREYYAETDAVVAAKFAACAKSDDCIVPILCVGESLSEREAGQTEAVIERQLNTVLGSVGINGFLTKPAVIAYEPVWAIGTGKTASPEEAQEVHKFIRSLLAQHDKDIANGVRILYGGSVKAENATELFVQADIDGGLIGGASLNVESFAGICEAAQKLASK